MNLRDLASKVKGYIEGKTQDDEGWIQQGRFTVPQNVKKVGFNILNDFNRQQESLYGNTNGSYSNQLKTSLPGQAATKVNTLFSNFSTPEKQQAFNDQPVSGFGQGLKSYVKNRYVAPIAQVPYRAKQLIGGKSAGEKIQGGLGLLGGTVAMVPDPFGDILYPGYEYLKGVAAAQKRGEGTLQSYKTGLSDLRGQTSTGAGTAFGKTDTQETLGNLLELPVMLAVSGKVGKNKIKAEEILKLSDDIGKYSILAKNYSKLNPDIQMNVIGKITEYSKKIIPDVINNKEMKELSMRDPAAWLKYLSNFLDDSVMNARHPELNFGFNTRTLKKLDDQPIKTGGDIKAGQYGYIHNLEKSPKPNVGDQFGQNIEPAGKYMNLTSSVERAIEQGKYFTDNGVKNMESGVVDFKNPLVIDNTGKFTKDWKIELSKRYGGKTGKELSNAIIKDGYDGIITTDNGVPSETVYFDKLLPNISPIKTGGASNLSPESKGIIKLKDNDLVKTFDETIKVGEQPKIKVRGLTESVQESPNITSGTKVKVTGQYEVKPTEQLMGEAKALLTEGGSIKDVNKVQNIDAKITATIQEAINLDKIGKHDEAAALFNNLSTTGTELGRGVHAFSLLNQMSPEAITLSAVGRIKKYNETAKVKIPELNGEQQKMISDSVRRIQGITDERMKNIELNKLQEQISSFIPSTFVDKLITTWKAGLLTSPRTTLRNLGGNTIMQGGEIAASKPTAIADYLLSLKTGQRTTTGNLQGTLSGAKEGFDKSIDVMKYGFDPSESISKFDTKKITWGNNPVEQTLKKYTNFVFNSLSAQDKPFWNSSYARSLYDQAAATAINQGQKGNQKLIQSLVDNATEQMKVIATNDANYATFKDKNMISNIAAGFKRAAGQKEWSKLPAEIIAPFTGVPSSIVGKTIDYSPLGLIKGSINAGKVLTKNIPELQRQAAQEIGRGTVGTAIFGLGSYLMAKGLMTGQPKDDAERKQWELEGKQQNSVLVDGKWRSINSVGPQTLVLLAGAKYNEEMNSPEGSMVKYGLDLGKDQLSQTFLSGVQQPLNAITDPNRYGKSYVGGQVASFIPNIVKDTSKALDPLARETDTGSFLGNVKTSAQSGVPIWRNQMTPKRDVLGNVIKQEPTGIGAYIDLFNSKTPISNDVVNELSRLNEAGYNATPSKLQVTQTIKGVKGKLTQQQLDVLETKSGLATSTAIDKLIKTPAYQKLDDEDKQSAIDDLVTKTRKQVRATIDLTVMPDMGYTTSADSPKGLGKVGLYGKSLITDPGQTLKAVVDGNPIRKVEGGAVILERKNALGTLDAGDKTTEVDHIIALSLGGTNDKSNLQILNKAENRIKGQVEVYLLGELKAGRITKEEAQKRDKNWKDEIDNLSKSTKEKLVTELSTDTADTENGETNGETYQIINEDTGSITTIDLSKPVEEPDYTGFDELDKKLKSSYKSAISTRISNITKLYKDGQIDAEKANKLISELQAKSGSSSKKPKKISVKLTKYTSPKANIKFSSPRASKFKLKPSPKLKISKTDNRKYTIKA